MRETRNAQASIFDHYAKHEIGNQLAMMSGILDGCEELLSWVEADLSAESTQPTGRTGLPVESVLRCAILKQVRQLSYKELVFYLEDSGSFRSFARLPQGVVPKKSGLQGNISRIKPRTWERINQAIVGQALTDGVECCNQVRVDSTVVATNIHEPSDSSLLNDGIRILTRLMVNAKKKLKVPGIDFTDRRKPAKSLARQVFYTRGMAKKEPLYKDLLAYAEQVMKESSDALWHVQLYRFRGPAYGQWIDRVKHYRRLLRRVIRQTRRRVLKGESVPATEKVVSLHEPHTDIIVKGSRDIQYGHKINLTTGREGLVLDATIESGNPCDTERYLPMIQRQVAIYGQLPGCIAADGGYASTANLKEAKALGVGEVAFQKKKGLTIDAMTSSQKLYKQLCNFRAGIESNTSELKRAYGLKRSLWRGLQGFMADVWSSIVSYNLVRMARLNST
ncbi:ISNCY family transposase [Seongchinamella sediminis]|uniref:ISNCY family transposase n=1 Tax=Seongchinamella sediminis TaxID=2283635 RepID=A0A3L7DVJ7_9GAMM|nr:ISNCY family transposase [Seongchinamella sediminis]RLQ21324.1 ISNCY family transposase [Seongchinamella sediminis]